MFGKLVQEDTYDYQTDSIDMSSCDLPSYQKLVNLCFHQASDSILIASFIRFYMSLNCVIISRSICLHDINKSQNIYWDPVRVEGWNSSISDTWDQQLHDIARLSAAPTAVIESLFTSERTEAVNPLFVKVSSKKFL